MDPVNDTGKYAISLTEVLLLIVVFVSTESDCVIGMAYQSAIDFLKGDAFSCTRTPVEPVRSSNESKIRAVRLIMASLSGDYLIPNVWVL